jgi:hypothetical protein
MSRSLGSDGIRLYCDAAVALTIVFATVIAMVAAVIVGSNPLNFSVAIIALCLPVQSHVFTHGCRRMQPAGIYIIENKDKTHDNLSFIAYRSLLRLDHVFYQAARNFGAHSYQFKALNFSLDNLRNNERIAFNRP